MPRPLPDTPAAASSDAESYVGDHVEFCLGDCVGFSRSYMARLREMGLGRLDDLHVRGTVVGRCGPGRVDVAWNPHGRVTEMLISSLREAAF